MLFQLFKVEIMRELTFFWQADTLVLCYYKGCIRVIGMSDCLKTRCFLQLFQNKKWEKNDCHSTAKCTTKCGLPFANI